ncbi:ADP-ribosyltransferase domain-containing protein [Nocardia fusca]|uniref:ADP-ribosyltransferase domain-containing protein n=1 Tax=Nocardia fusca TaxID=941183 RepID=UPI0037934692
MVNKIQKILLKSLGRTERNIVSSAEFRRRFLEANADAIRKDIQIKLDAERLGTTGLPSVVTDEERNLFWAAVRKHSYEPPLDRTQKIPEGFTDADRGRASHYLGDGFRTTNLKLRAGDRDAGKFLRETLLKFDIYTGIGFRGVDLPDRILELYREGNIVRDKGFVSCSKYLRGAKDRSTLLRIYTQSGRDVSEYSKYRHEAEFIIPDDMPMKVLYRQDPTPYNEKRYIDLLEL